MVSVDSPDGKMLQYLYRSSRRRSKIGMARKHGLESAMKNTRGRTMKREGKKLPAGD
jgi:hypothetical protein